MGKIAIWVPTVGVIFAVCVFVVSGLVSASAQAYLVGTVRTGAALRQGMRQFLPCFVSSLLFGLLAILLAVVLIGLWKELCKSLVPRSYFSVLTMLTMVPVLGWFVTCWSFFVSTFLVEGTSMRTGLRRGRDLIRRTWWRVAGMIFGIFLFSFALSFIFRTTIGGLLTLTELVREWRVYRRTSNGSMGYPCGAIWIEFFQQPNVYYICLGGDTFAMPIWGVGSTLLYFDQRIRKEAFDIEMMATHQGLE